MVQTERTHAGTRKAPTVGLAAAASFAFALLATPPSQAQSPLPTEGYGYMHVTLWTMVSACIFHQPNFELSLVHNMIDDAQRIDMGDGLTVFRDSPTLGRSELHIQTVVDGEGYCLGFSPDATLADANLFMATYMSSDDSATMLFREVDAPGGGRAWEHRFSDYPVRIESVLVEGSGAGLRVSVSGVSEEQLTLLAGSIPHVPRHLPGYPEVNMQYAWTRTQSLPTRAAPVELSHQAEAARSRNGTMCPITCMSRRLPKHSHSNALQRRRDSQSRKCAHRRERRSRKRNHNPTPTVRPDPSCFPFPST
jgi:hypothetical protein